MDPQFENPPRDLQNRGRNLETDGTPEIPVPVPVVEVSSSIIPVRW
jgi:hypothetical protein